MTCLIKLNEICTFKNVKKFWYFVLPYDSHWPSIHWVTSSSISSLWKIWIFWRLFLSMRWRFWICFVFGQATFNIVYTSTRCGCHICYETFRPIKKLFGTDLNFNFVDQYKIKLQFCISNHFYFLLYFHLRTVIISNLMMITVIYVIICLRCLGSLTGRNRMTSKYFYPWRNRRRRW